MLENQFKYVLAILGAGLIPVCAHADQSVDSGQPSYRPGEVVKVGQLQAGYNQSASYDCANGWDLFLTADYIYWIWQQSLMEVATSITPILSGSSAFFNGSGEVIFQTPGYRSGFQVGLGCNLHGMDDWNLYSEYTWYKNKSDLHTVASQGEYVAVSQSLLQTVSGVSQGILLSDDLFTTAQMNFNCLDLVLGRPFYFGRKLVANFSGGLRALWIHQKFTATGSELSFIGSNVNLPAAAAAASFNSSSNGKSWAIGPKFSFDPSWLLGGGVRIIGEFSLSALYTSYITLQSTITGAVSDIEIADLEFNQTSNYNIINPITESSLGLAWGMYFCNNSFHVDISASYDFNVYWNYNLLDVLVNNNGTPGNMCLHGLNVQARFDF